MCFMTYNNDCREKYRRAVLSIKKWTNVKDVKCKLYLKINDSWNRLIPIVKTVHNDVDASIVRKNEGLGLGFHRY